MWFIYIKISARVEGNVVLSEFSQPVLPWRWCHTVTITGPYVFCCRI